ncbi:MAG: type II toxin-antitoxin system VapC family toxin [Desulfatibacillum sp.]|nr:type II toxin-antitoxin system VapC family toxin [Desulfatibacillum sp.]
MRYMLDTNICIYIIKKKPSSVLARLREIPVSDVCISSITLAELEYGIAKSARPQQNLEALSGFLAPLELVEFGPDAASSYGILRAALEKMGQPIGSMDMLIAAHSLSMALTLVTNNEREFARVPGLLLENWASFQ